MFIFTFLADTKVASLNTKGQVILLNSLSESYKFPLPVTNGFIYFSYQCLHHKVVTLLKQQKFQRKHKNTRFNV